MADEKRMIDLLVDEYEGSVQTITMFGREIRVRPMVTAEYRKIAALYPDDTAKQQAEAIVRMCKDKNGASIFSREDRAKLMTSVRMERFGALLAVIYGRSLDEQVKNSEADGPETTSALH